MARTFLRLALSPRGYEKIFTPPREFHATNVVGRPTGAQKGGEVDE
jgi:hypothetical protein